jgi:hypothetical protein
VRKSVERIILLVAALLLISSGGLFYRYVTFNVGEGGNAGFLMERIEEQALLIAQLEHAFEVFREAAIASGDGMPGSIAAADVDDLGKRVTSLEITLRMKPDQALQLPLMQQDLLQLGDRIEMLQFANSSAITITYGLLGFLGALILLVMGYLFGPLISTRLSRNRNKSGDSSAT